MKLFLIILRIYHPVVNTSTTRTNRKQKLEGFCDKMGLKGSDYYIRRSRKKKFDLIRHDNEQNGKETVILHRIPEEDAHGLLFGLHLGWLSGSTLVKPKKNKEVIADERDTGDSTGTYE